MSGTPETAQHEALWTVSDVAAYLKLARSWVYQASASGVLPCVRIGAALRFDPKRVRAWVHGPAERTAPATVALPGCR